MPEELMSFAKDIKPLFRHKDKGAMSWAFDLGDHADVSENAELILERLQEGTMPCDSPWPEDRVALFERWVQAGKPE